MRRARGWLARLVAPLGGGRSDRDIDAELRSHIDLHVADNIRAAGWMFRADDEYRKDAVERVLRYFPILRTRWDTPAGNLSGGEQQMLSLAQAMLARPKLLLVDELSLGLAPKVVDALLQVVSEIHKAGTAVIIVKQSVTTALRFTGRT